MSLYVISGKCCVYSVWLNVIIITFWLCFHLHQLFSSQIPFASVWWFSSHCRNSKLQQLCQHFQDESKLLCPDFSHFPHHPAFGSRDVAALFPRTRGYCHSSQEQTHPESWWESELHTMVQIFILIHSLTSSVRLIFIFILVYCHSYFIVLSSFYF